MRSRIVEVEGEIEEAYSYIEGSGMGDGFPVIAPTESRVRYFLDYAKGELGREADEVLVVVLPGLGEATVEKVVINSIMAGAKPEYLPVIFAAMELVGECQEKASLQFKGSHSESLTMVLNGPVRQKLGFESGSRGMFVSWRANVTINRAVRFVIHNIGGLPGLQGKRTFGWLVWYPCGIAENEEDSPWEPYHVERGFKRSDSTICVLGVETPHHMELGRWPYTLQELLAGFADSMSTAAHRSAYGEYLPTLFLGPEHANALAGGGFSKADVKRFIYENAKTPYYKFGPKASEGFAPEWQKFYTWRSDALVPMCKGPDDIHIFVVGGPGPNTLYLPMQRWGVAIKRIENV